MGQTAALCAPSREGAGLVRVHVYDCSSAPTAALAGSTTYQVTLEIHGREHSFRANDGIFSQPLGEYPELECREAVQLGRISASAREVEAIIKDLSASYTGSQFDVLTRNSGHFCNDLCLSLGVHSVPASFMSLAGQGVSAGEHVAKVATDVRSAAAAVAAKASELEVVAAAVAHMQSFKAKAEEMDAKARSGISSKKADLSARAQAFDAKLGVSATTAGLAARAADARDSIRKEREVRGGSEDSEGYRFGDLTRGLMKAAWSTPSASRP